MAIVTASDDIEFLADAREDVAADLWEDEGGDDYQTDYEERFGMEWGPEDEDDLVWEYEDDGQPTMYEEYQDLYGGDDYYQEYPDSDLWNEY